MNPEVTTTSATGIDVRFLIAANAAARAARPRRPVPQIDVEELIEEPTIDSAEQARQDSLEFLHKLVMG